MPPLGFENFYIDENTLWDLPKDPKVVQKHIDQLLTDLTNVHEIEAKVKLLGEIGGLYRNLQKLDLAEKYLTQSTQLIEKHKLGPRFHLTHNTRLAHVFQWQKRFHESNELFEQLMQFAEENQSCADIKDFVYQHHGKNLFDQQRYQEALTYFEKALTLRKQKNNSELIGSTEIAIRRTKELLEEKT